MDDAPLTPAWLGSLGPEERARAAAFHFAEDRRRFLLAHGGMRHLLGEYLQCAPASVSMTSGAFGKPLLTLETGHRFNLSHSVNLAVLAVARGCEVGVDVECCTDDSHSLIFDQLSIPEQVLLRGLPPETAHETFLAIWTRKEALLKGLGLGLQGDLGGFSALPQTRRPVLHTSDERMHALSHFDCITLSAVAHGYQGAVAVQAQDTVLRLAKRTF